MVLLLHLMAEAGRHGRMSARHFKSFLLLSSQTYAVERKTVFAAGIALESVAAVQPFYHEMQCPKWSLLLTKNGHHLRLAM